MGTLQYLWRQHYQRQCNHCPIARITAGAAALRNPECSALVAVRLVLVYPQENRLVLRLQCGVASASWLVFSCLGVREMLMSHQRELTAGHTSQSMTGIIWFLLFLNVSNKSL